VSDGNNFNAVSRDTIDNHKRKAFHDVALSPEQVGRPAIRIILNSTPSILEFVLKCFGSLNTTFGVPMVCFKRFDACIRVPTPRGAGSAGQRVA